MKVQIITPTKDARLISLPRRQKELTEAIDEALWYGDKDVSFLDTQLEEVQTMIDKGELWYPNF
jgi:hypothetical protein